MELLSMIHCEICYADIVSVLDPYCTQSKTQEDVLTKIINIKDVMLIISGTTVSHDTSRAAC